MTMTRDELKARIEPIMNDLTITDHQRKLRLKDLLLRELNPDDDFEGSMELWNDVMAEILVGLHRTKH